MTKEFYAFADRCLPELEAALADRLPLSSQPKTELLNRAIHYTLFPSGKRLRPLLTLLGAAITGGSVRAAMPAACAVEYLHASSLALDDLPSMDDADLRRGRPALHLVFGEAVATLAALALMNHAYALLAGAAAGNGEKAVERIIAEATACIGSDGMIGGQVADLESSLASRNLKTSALMRLTMTAGAIACGAKDRDTDALARFGESLGAAYQIADDLIDELDDSRITGKTARQDSRHLRSTIITEIGIDGARNQAARLIEEAKLIVIERFSGRAAALPLVEAADAVVRRAGRLNMAVNMAAGD